MRRRPTLRIAFLVTDYPTEAGRTAGIFHKTLADALARAGADLRVVAPVPRVPWPLDRLNRRWGRYREIPEAYVLEQVAVRRPRYWQVPGGNSVSVGHGSFARCLRDSFDEAPDVIHAHFGFPCGVAALDVAARWGVPTVLTLHGSDVNVFPSLGPRANRFFRRAVTESTFVIAVSDALARRTELLTGRRPAVMPIGIDLKPFESLPTKAAAREMLGLPGHGRLILFVGALVAAKGVSVLLEALEKLGSSDVLGVFVGDGPLRGRVAGAPRTITVGPVTQDRVRAYMAAADLLVLPSFSEGMPTVVVEAGAAGLPVVGSRVGGIAEILDAGRGLLVPPDDAGELEMALRISVDDPDESAKRALRLKDLIGREYDADENAKAVLRVYEDLL